MTDATRALIREVREALGKATPGPWLLKTEQVISHRYRDVMDNTGRPMRARMSPLCEPENVAEADANEQIVIHAPSWLAELCEALEEEDR